MLNTALHNPNVRQKITLEQFVAQNRGINSGKDLPKDILVSLFTFLRYSNHLNTKHLNTRQYGVRYSNGKVT